jgi:hypothetical protein
MDGQHVRVFESLMASYSAARRSNSLTMSPPGTPRDLSGFSTDIPLSYGMEQFEYYQQQTKLTFFHPLRTSFLRDPRHRFRHHHHLLQERGQCQMMRLNSCYQSSQICHYLLQGCSSKSDKRFDGD